MALIPQNIEAEERMIGAMILGAYEKVIEANVTIEWFWGGDTQFMFNLMDKLAESGQEVNEATVRFGVIKAGKHHLNHHIETYIEKTAHQDNWELWIKDLKQTLFRRKTFQAALELKNAAENPDASVEEIFAKVDSGLAEMRIEQTNAEQTQLESVQEIVALLGEIWNGKRDILGFQSGYPDIDRVLGGLRRQNLIIIAARPGVGKTSLITNMAVRLATAKDPVPVGFFSLEMSRMELNIRMASVIGKTNMQNLLNGGATESELSRAKKALPQVAKLPVTINDKAGVHVNYIRQCARRMVRDGAKVIMVDYLQLLKASKSKGSRNDEITEISGGLKLMAKELNVPVIALSQMNREFEKTSSFKGKEVKRKPRMSDLRDGGAIEQDADSIGFLHEGEDGMFFCVAKNRHGQVGDIPLTWIKEHTRFESAAHESMVPGS